MNFDFRIKILLMPLILILTLVIFNFSTLTVKANTVSDPCLSILINEVNPGTEQVELFNPTTNLCVFGSDADWKLTEASGEVVNLVGNRINPGGFLTKEFSSGGAGNLKDSGDRVNFLVNDQVLDSIEWGKSLKARVPDPEKDQSLIRVPDGQNRWIANANSTLNATNNLADSMLPSVPTNLKIAASLNSPEGYIGSLNHNNVSVSLATQNDQNQVDKFTIVLSDIFENQSNQQTSSNANSPVSKLDASSLTDGAITIRGYSRKATLYSAWSNGAAVKDVSAPGAAVVTNPIGNVLTNKDSLTVEGLVETDSLARIFRDSNNNGQIDDNERSPVAEFKSLDGRFRFEVSLEFNRVNKFFINTIDVAGNTAAFTAIPTVTQDAIAPMATEKVALVEQEQGKILLSWIPSSDIDVTTYRIYHSQADQVLDFSQVFGVTETGIVSYQTGQLSSGKHNFVVRTIDRAGNESNNSSPISLIISSPLNQLSLDQTNQAFDLTRRYGLNLTANVNVTGKANLSVIDQGGNLPKGQLPTGLRFLNQYFEMTLDNSSAFPIDLKFYYTKEQLTNAQVTEKQLLGIYFYDQASNDWKSFTNTGINLTNVILDGKEYEGFLFATADHFTPISFAADVVDPGKPVNLLAKSEDKKVGLSWDVAVDAAYYEVRYREATNRDSTVYNIIRVNGTNTTIDIENLINNKLYEFGVRSMDLAGNGSDFAVVNQTPQLENSIDKFVVPKNPEPITDQTTTKSPTSNQATQNDQVDGASAIGGSVSPIYDLSATEGKAEATKEVKAAITQDDEEASTINDIDDEEDSGEIKGGQKDRDRAERTRALITFLIIAAAAAAGFGGYYGYQWWIERPDSQIPPRQPVFRASNLVKKKSKEKNKVKRPNLDDGRW